MAKTALIIVSNDSEDSEIIITCNVLRRSGVEVTLAGLQNENTIVTSRKISLNVDKHFNDILNNTYDAVILPGGQPGSDNLCKDSNVGEVLRHHESQGKIVAAICAAPLALKSHKVAVGGTITSYPSLASQFEDYNYVEDKVVVWNNVVTSRGPGTTFEFGLKLAELLVGKETADTVRSAMLL